MGLEDVVKEITNEIDRLTHVLRVLTGVKTKGKPATGSRRRMSAAARRKISLAQKARWKKWKADKKK